MLFAVTLLSCVGFPYRDWVQWRSVKILKFISINNLYFIDLKNLINSGRFVTTQTRFNKYLLLHFSQTSKLHLFCKLVSERKSIPTEIIVATFHCFVTIYKIVENGQGISNSS